MATSLSSLFEQCGLNKTEAAVMNCLLLEGATSAARIAKLTDIKRPTVYAALDMLCDTGLIVKDRRTGKGIFTPVEHSLISEILENTAKAKYSRITQAAQQMQKILKEIPRSPVRRIGPYEIRSTDSPSLIRRQLMEALTSGDFVAIFNPQIIPTPILKMVSEEFLSVTAKTAPMIRELGVAGPKADLYEGLIANKNHHFKRLPKDTDIQSDIILYNGTVVITHHDKGNELSLRIREDRFYTTLRTMFELLWANSR